MGGFKLHYVEWGIGLTCAAFATIASLALVRRHITHFYNAACQRRIIRIILMVPVYSVDSAISMILPDWALIVDTFRDCYEAYVLWEFYGLCCAFLGGEANLAEKLESLPKHHHPFPLSHVWYQPGKRFLFHCKQGILQYVIVKPLMALLAVGLYVGGVYGEGSFSPRRGFLYITIVNNLSVSVSLYCLALFYHTSRGFIKDLRPLRKFLVIKFVIFFSFWQEVVIALLMYIGVIHDLSEKWTARDVGTSLQDFLICVEMAAAAIFHYYAFGWREFRPKDVDSTKAPRVKGVVQTVFMKDVAYEVVDAFRPSHISGKHHVSSRARKPRTRTRTRTHGPARGAEKVSKKVLPVSSGVVSADDAHIVEGLPSGVV